MEHKEIINNLTFKLEHRIRFPKGDRSERNDLGPRCPKLLETQTSTFRRVSKIDSTRPHLLSHNSRQFLGQIERTCLTEENTR